MIKEKIAVVSDFDGFLTDLGKMAENFYGSFEDYLAKQINIGRIELADRMATIRTDIINKPSRYPFRYNGEIIAAAVADPYILERVVASKLISDLRQEANKSLSLPNDDDIEEVLRDLMELAGPHAGIIFRDGAAGFITEFKSSGQLVIATGSRSDKVQMLISKNLGIAEVNIVGPAHKYSVDHNWTEEIPDSNALIIFKGFPYPLSTRRRAFYEAVMAAVKGPIGVASGDSLAIDGLPFHALGIPFVQLKTEYIPDWEIAYSETDSLVSVEQSLSDVAQRIRTLE